MKKFIVSGIVLCLLSTSARTQRQADSSSYAMQPVAIKTRWAKQVNPKQPLPEYPRPQMVRSHWINLNGLWNYAIAGNDEAIPVKFDGNILVPYPLESALSGVKKSLDPNNVIWYNRKFISPILNSKERLLLNFGAVSWEATVYINGKQAGYHTGSYTAFSIDITTFAKHGENDLTIKVSNPLEKGIGPRGKQTLFPGSMWYTPSSGIWQTAWLEKVPVNYIEYLKINSDIDKKEVRITAFVKCHMKDFNVAAIVKAGGKILESKVNAVRTEGNELVAVDLVLPVAKIRLWSPDDPYLYDLTVQIKQGNKVLDEVKSYFGMRKIEIKKDDKGSERILLNYNYTYNLGTLDQGFWPEGLYTAPADEALKFDIEAAKAMGFNTIRKHIKVEPARWYYHADKLGVLVWQDLVQPSVKHGYPLSQESKKQFEKESSEILAQLDHFPSIITWVLFNEGWGEYDQERLAKWIKTTDPTRLINGHSGAAIVDGNVPEGAMAEVISRSVNSDMVDIHSYPSPAISKYVPGRALVLGEFGGIGVRIENHLWDDLQTVFSYGKTVNCGRMLKIYQVMIDSLVEFEKRGLSASIYTQPYDVESEQNGIMTYDREKTKIPFNVLRSIHGKLWPAPKNISNAKSKLNISVADTLITGFDQRLVAFKGGKRDSAFLRNLTLLAAAKKNETWVKTLSDAYVDQLQDPLAEVNLKFIKKFSSSSSNKAFEAIKNNKDLVNSLLGKNEQAIILMEIIYKESIAPRIEGNSNPDWNTIEIELASQYIGLSDIVSEKLLQTQMLYAFNTLHDWNQVAAIQDRWFNMKNPVLIFAEGLNDIAWVLFENVSDSAILNKAANWSQRSMELEPERATWYMDTYANILYKLGRTQEALIWEKKAADGNPNDDQIKNSYERMLKGLPTWIKQ